MRRTVETGSRTANGIARNRLVGFAVATVVVLSVAVAGAGAAASTDDVERDEPRSALIVDLEADGDATVLVTLSFDLEDDADRETFEAFRANETKRDRLERRTASRMERVAEATSDRTGREMTIDGAATSLETDGDRGLVTVAVTWRNLATVSDGDLRLSEPFASGFEPDRTVVLRPPDGYALERATPDPATNSADRIAWSPDAAFDGFEVTLTAAGNDDANGSDAGSDGSAGEPSGTETTGAADDQPGFVVKSGLAAVLTVGWMLRRRRN